MSLGHIYRGYAKGFFWPLHQTTEKISQQKSWKCWLIWKFGQPWFDRWLTLNHDLFQSQRNGSIHWTVRFAGSHPFPASLLFRNGAEIRRFNSLTKLKMKPRLPERSSSKGIKRQLLSSFARQEFFKRIAPLGKMKTPKPRLLFLLGFFLANSFLTCTQKTPPTWMEKLMNVNLSYIFLGGRNFYYCLVTLV